MPNAHCSVLLNVLHIMPHYIQLLYSTHTHSNALRHMYYLDYVDEDGSEAVQGGAAPHCLEMGADGSKQGQGHLQGARVAVLRRGKEGGMEGEGEREEGGGKEGGGGREEGRGREGGREGGKEGRREGGWQMYSVCMYVLCKKPRALYANGP